jgi:hypothetical protein
MKVNFVLISFSFRCSTSQIVKFGGRRVSVTGGGGIVEAGLGPMETDGFLSAKDIKKKKGVVIPRRPGSHARSCFTWECCRTVSGILSIGFFVAGFLSFLAGEDAIDTFVMNSMKLLPGNAFTNNW